MPTRKTSTKSIPKKTASKAKTASSKKKASPKKKTAKKKSPAKKSSAKSKSTKADGEVTIDRRRSERRDDEVAANEEIKKSESKPKLERRAKVSRRRQIDPTTCERDYSDQEVEFMSALDDYKRKSGRMFPTCSEVLEVLRDLGYVQLSSTELAAHNAETNDSESVSATSEWSPADEVDAETIEADAELV